MTTVKGLFTAGDGVGASGHKFYMRNETRFRVVEKTDPERFKRALVEAQRSVSQRFAVYQQLAGVTIPNVPSEE